MRYYSMERKKTIQSMLHLLNLWTLVMRASISHRSTSSYLSHISCNFQSIRSCRTSKPLYIWLHRASVRISSKVTPSSNRADFESSGQSKSASFSGEQQQQFRCCSRSQGLTTRGLQILRVPSPVSRILSGCTNTRLMTALLLRPSYRASFYYTSSRARMLPETILRASSWSRYRPVSLRVSTSSLIEIVEYSIYSLILQEAPHMVAYLIVSRLASLVSMESWACFQCCHACSQCRIRSIESSLEKVSSRKKYCISGRSRWLMTKPCSQANTIEASVNGWPGWERAGGIRLPILDWQLIVIVFNSSTISNRSTRVGNTGVPSCWTKLQIKQADS